MTASTDAGDGSDTSDPVEQRREPLREMDDDEFLQALAEREHLRISTLAETVLAGEN